MKTQNTFQCNTQILEECNQNEFKYGLLKIRVEKADRFAIYIERLDDCALECLDMTEEEALFHFHRIVKGELFPYHLRDYLDDLRVEKF